MASKTPEESISIAPEKIYNNLEHSDVIIRYGPLNAKVFYGHRQTLASESRWFRKAFEGQFFKESQDKEITLHGDDAAALDKMFEFIYFHKSNQYWYPLSFGLEYLENRQARVDFQLNIYEAADKYDVPELLRQIPSMFHFDLGVWMHAIDYPVSPGDEAITKDVVFDTIERAYNLTAAWKQSDLREKLFSCIHSSISREYDPEYMWASDGKLVIWLRDFVEAVPEFGKDLYLHTLPRPPTPYEGSTEIT
ncbi:hypothetical protein K491DRAFT_721404 [Lophiostoma macrostomum CBS 122681]|uniref:BTB domain-containing protein n=1 Tax=Lophiostoma macrostomum CBS 122681 TaxID=1314788 RepID=A0A6A6SPU5_9PLEO|nr:hypothetical protein K491DRAFT_721404 [Lophiostoma macrostomum CBS 122681]